MAKNNEAKLSKKCKRCTLDCQRVRLIAFKNIPESERQEAAMKAFGTATAKYTVDTCPKK